MNIFIKKKILIIIIILLLYFSCYGTKKFSGTDKGKDTPKKWGYNYKEIKYLTNDSILISAWEIIQNEKNPWIILIPGYEDNKSDDKIRITFKKLAGDKYNFILIDPRGFGKSHGITSYGIREKYEILGAIKYIRKREYKGKIGLIGFSQGAAASILATSENEEIKALVIWAPYADFSNEIEYFLKWKFGNTKNKLLKWAKKNPQKVKYIYERFYRVNLNNEKPVKLISNIKIPILLGHGKKDTLIPYSNALQLIKMNKNIRFITLSGGHSMYAQDINERNAFLNEIKYLMKNNLWE